MRIFLTIFLTAAVTWIAYGKYDEYQRLRLETEIAATPIPSAPVDVPSVPDAPVAPDKPPGSETNPGENRPAIVESYIEARLNSLDAKLTELLSLSKNTETVVGTPYDDAKLMEKIKTLECYLGELIYWKRGETPVKKPTSEAVSSRAVIPEYAGYTGYSGGYIGTCTNGSCFRGGGYP